MEPLKYCYNDAFMSKLNALIEPLDKNFNAQQFRHCVFSGDWGSYELKQRMSHITRCLNTHLSGDYAAKIKTLKPVSEHFDSYDAMFFSDFVEQFGLDDFDESMQAMFHFTQFCTAEFAVRPFIERYPDKMMAQMMAWAGSEKHHVRRLASEGCRPRLPWASALAKFKKDPSVIFPILEALKNDDSEYVRKSVANNLNDISKDNPDRVISLAKRWKGHSKKTDWIVKHACRSLLKQAHPEIMSLYGYSEPKQIQVSELTCSPQLSIGQTLSFSFTLSSPNIIGLCRLEFALYFVKANNKLAKKIFKISESNINALQKSFRKNFSFEPRSTRKLYAGEHCLGIIVNGFELQRIDFALLP